MSDAVVLPFRPRPDAPIQAFPDRVSEVIDQFEAEGESPKRPFGYLPPGSTRLASLRGGIDAAMGLARDTDRRGADYIRRAAKAAADALSGRAPPPACPTLLQEASGRLNAGAAGWRDVAQFLETLGCFRQARTAYDMAEIAETMSAEVLIPVTPEGA